MLAQPPPMAGRAEELPLALLPRAEGAQRVFLRGAAMGALERSFLLAFESHPDACLHAQDREENQARTRGNLLKDRKLQEHRVLGKVRGGTEQLGISTCPRVKEGRSCEPGPGLACLRNGARQRICFQHKRLSSICECGSNGS